MHTLSIWADVGLCVVLILAGSFAGFAGAFFGVGGGTVLVPTLLGIYSYINTDLNVDMHQAVAGSLALVVVNTMMSAYQHYMQGNLDGRYFKGWALWLGVGVALGALAMSSVDSFTLKLCFAAYLLFAACHELFFDRTDQKRNEHLPTGVFKAIGGLMIGACSVILGIAGGTFSTPFFRAFGATLQRAMALAVSGGVVISCAGTMAAMISGYGVPHRLPGSIGYVNVLTVVFVAPFVMWASPLGVKVSCRTSPARLKVLYVLFLSGLVFSMIYGIIRHWL